MTKHEKDALLAPLVAAAFGAYALPTPRVDTDALGTFTGEIARPGSAREVVVEKARRGLAAEPRANFALASEGSYHAHPLFGASLGEELVAFVTRDRVPIIGRALATSPAAQAKRVRDHDAARAAAAAFGFPDHGLVVVGDRAGDRNVRAACVKDVIDEATLDAAVANVLANCGAAWIENDLRAHRNPTRRRSIVAAAEDAIARARTPCPACACAGFGKVGVEAGLPCDECGTATERIASDVLGCPACDHRELLARPHAVAGPGDCPTCNP